MNELISKSEKLLKVNDFWYFIRSGEGAWIYFNSPDHQYVILENGYVVGILYFLLFSINMECDPRVEL
ncbi:YydF family exported signaling peptide [Paenibacillus amylolyticus]|uniref:YydF family exported signaling peptide n=1 Tax=Paenibacillus amylolyticus TaxID=1451 RepID=A0A5M9X1C7_PAEAM|nr:YydF family exported signaling peptide [Paenibacillus amylolyticus]